MTCHSNLNMLLLSFLRATYNENLAIPRVFVFLITSYSTIQQIKKGYMQSD